MIYRVFCCSDTHGRLPAVPTGEFDATLHAGDVYNGAELTAGEAAADEAIAGWIDPETAAVAAWIEEAAPVHVVRGNHDLGDPHRFFAQSRDVTGRTESLGERLLVAGLGWHGERYYELPGESEMAPRAAGLRRQIRRLLGSRDCLVLLTHYPPKLPSAFSLEVPDVGWWHECTRELLEEYGPVLVVQGHIHELSGCVVRIDSANGTTLVVSPGKRGMIVNIDTDLRRAEVARVL